MITAPTIQKKGVINPTAIEATIRFHENGTMYGAGFISVF